jgi:hypothetical protein
VDAVRPLWESLSKEERVAMLTVDLHTLRQRAKQEAEVARLQQQRQGGCMACV